MADIVLFGPGQMGQSIRAYIDRLSDDRVVAYVVDDAFRSEDRFDGLPVASWETLETDYPPAQVSLLGPVSYRRLNGLRRERHLQGRARGYAFARFIHPSATVEADTIGENTIILDGNCIQPFARIGQGVLMSCANYVAHHAEIGDYCFLAGQAGLGGAARLGEGCFLGLKATIEPGLTVGAESFVGAGAVIKRNLAPKSVVKGPRTDVADFPSDRLLRLDFR